MHQCSTCQFPSRFAMPFCPRCGASGFAQPPLDAYLRRTHALRLLVVNRAWDSLLGVKLLRPQLAAIAGLEAEGSAALGPAAYRKWIGRELACVREELDLSLRHQALELLCQWLPAAEAEDLHHQFARTKRVIGALQAVAKLALEGKLSQQAAASELERVSGQTGVGVAELRGCIFATPHYWSRFAKTLDPVELERSLWRGLLGYGYEALKAKNYEAAQQHFTRAQSLQPNEPAVHVALGDWLVAQEQKDSAIGPYRRAAELGTTNVRALNSLAWFLGTKTLVLPREIELAQVAAERAASLAPLAHILDTLAEVRNRRGDLQGALSAIRAALLDQPDKDAYRQRLQALVESASLSFEGLADSNEIAPLLSLDEDEADSLGGNSDSGICLEVADDNFDLDDESDDFAIRSVESVEMSEDDECMALDDECMALEDECMALEDECVALDDECVALDDECVALDDECVALDDECVAFDDCDEAPLLDASEDDELASASMPRTHEPAYAPRASATNVRSNATPRGDFSQAPRAPRDPVDCTVFAPPSAPPNETFMVQVSLHLPSQADEAKSIATEFDPSATRRGRTSLATEIARGTLLTFELVCRGAEVDEPLQSLKWNGLPEIATFFVTAPGRGATLPCKVLVLQDGAPIGEVRFLVALQPSASPAAPAPAGEAVRYQTAFASYASQDRPEVLPRVQALRAAGINCFQDVLDLEPGQRWQQQLWRRIDEADVLFLFWSEHAKTSEWVTKEWQYGLQKKGLDFIRPVILQREPFCEPPDALRELHFNDVLLYLIQKS